MAAYFTYYAYAHQAKKSKRRQRRASSVSVAHMYIACYARCAGGARIGINVNAREKQ